MPIITQSRSVSIRPMVLCFSLRPLLWEKGANETSATDATSANVTNELPQHGGEENTSASNQSNGLNDGKGTEPSANEQEKTTKKSSSASKSTKKDKLREFKNLIAHEAFHAFVYNLVDEEYNYVKQMFYGSYNDEYARSKYSEAYEQANIKNKKGEFVYSESHKPEEFIAYIVGNMIEDETIQDFIDELGEDGKLLIETYLKTIGYDIRRMAERSEGEESLRIRSDAKIPRIEESRKGRVSKIGRAEEAVIDTTDNGVSASEYYENTLRMRVYQIC